MGIGILGQAYVALIQGSGTLAGFCSGDWILGVWCFGVAWGGICWWLCGWGVRFGSSGVVFLWVGACGVLVGHMGAGGFGARGLGSLGLGVWGGLPVGGGVGGVVSVVWGVYWGLVWGVYWGLAWPGRGAGAGAGCGAGCGAGVRVRVRGVGGEYCLAFWILFCVCLCVDCMFSRWFILMSCLALYVYFVCRTFFLSFFSSFVGIRGPRRGKCRGCKCRIFFLLM